MGIDKAVNAKREEILRITEQYEARNVRLFGSRARGETRGDSDADLLVEYACWRQPPGCRPTDHGIAGPTWVQGRCGRARRVALVYPG